MKPLLLLLALLFIVPSAHATFGITQSVNTSGAACSTTLITCSLTVSSTGTGHAGVILWRTGSAVTASTMVTGGVWTIPAGCNNFAAPVGTTGCAYILALTSGVTTLTMTWSGINPGTPTFFQFYELNWTAPTISLLTTGNTADAVSSQSHVGVALTMTGAANAAIFQTQGTSGGDTTAIGGAYTLTYGATFIGTGRVINSIVGTAPTWTTGSPNNTMTGSAIAIKENQSQATRVGAFVVGP